jgi:uncharacterized membrane protein YqjE
MSPGPASPGLFHSARKLLANLAGVAHTRLELLSTELQEELARLAEILLATIISLFFAFLGIAFVAVAVMIAVGEPYRFAVAVLFSVSFLIIVALAVVVGPGKVLNLAARAAAFYGLTRRLAAALHDHPR